MNLSLNSLLSSDNKGYEGILYKIILFRDKVTFILSSLVFINSGNILYKGKELSDISLNFDVPIFWIIGSYPINSCIIYFISQIVDDI